MNTSPNTTEETSTAVGSEPTITLAFTASEIGLLMNAAQLGVAVVTGNEKIKPHAMLATVITLIPPSEWYALIDRVTEQVKRDLPGALSALEVGAKPTPKPATAPTAA